MSILYYNKKWISLYIKFIMPFFLLILSYMFIYLYIIFVSVWSWLESGPDRCEKASWFKAWNIYRGDTFTFEFMVIDFYLTLFLVHLASAILSFSYHLVSVVAFSQLDIFLQYCSTKRKQTLLDDRKNIFRFE